MSDEADSAQNGPSSISHEEIGNLPLKAYSGKVELIRNADDLPAVMAEVGRHEVVGFDTETRPSFRKGQLFKVSLMQLAVPNYVFLIRLQYTGITPELISFLESGDILLLYTDGITEPENEYGEMFGEERLIETVRRVAARPNEAILKEVFDAVRSWTFSPESADDMTMMIVRKV